MNSISMRHKAKLLSISLGLVMSALACNHFLWFRGGSHALIEHCAKLNSTNISLVNMARDYIEIGKLQSSIVNPPTYCSNLIPSASLDSLKEIDSIARRDSSVAFDAITDKLIIYSEQYSTIITEEDSLDKKIIAVILILNALGLVFLGFFLREDIKSISE